MLESSRSYLKDVKSFKKGAVFIRNLGNGDSESAKIQFYFEIENKNLHDSGVGAYENYSRC